MTNAKELKFRQIDGTERNLNDYKGNVLLIVNVASKCGLTPQYEGLEKVYQQYKHKGLIVMGFPANEFNGQEPGSNEEIHEFCQMSYGVQFPMFEKVIVKGESIHPLFRFLTETSPVTTTKPISKLVQTLKKTGLFGADTKDIMWNFEKFLINRDGKILARFAPDIKPEDPVLIDAIENALEDIKS